MLPLLGDVVSLVESGSFSAASNMLGVSQVHCPALTPLFLTTAALAEFPGNDGLKRASLLQTLKSERAAQLMSNVEPSGVSQDASEYVTPHNPLARITDEFGGWDETDARMALSTVVNGGGLWRLFLAMGKRYDLGPDIYSYLERSSSDFERSRRDFKARHDEDIASLEKGPPFSPEMTTRLARGFEGPMTTEGVLYYMREKLLAPSVDVPDCPALNPKRVRVLETLGDFYRRRCHVEIARHFFRRSIQTARDHIDLIRREREGRSNDGGIVRVFSAIDYGDFLETPSKTESPEEMFEQFRSRIEAKMS